MTASFNEEASQVSSTCYASNVSLNSYIKIREWSFSETHQILLSYSSTQQESSTMAFSVVCSTGAVIAFEGKPKVIAAERI